MKADELIKYFPMEKHVENGLFLVNNPPCDSHERQPSGCMYFYYYPNSDSKFHRLDCNEYWIYSAGAVLEMWLISPNGKLEVKKLGAEAGAQPTILVEAGTIFAGRHKKMVDDGTFLTNITVPRYSDDGFEIISKEDVIKLCPEAEAFWE